ncbi:hypothetical protein M7I_4332 [Glarea lozoyensis 74030]|uniref:Uncharacterized protein n=1 Tax=Glarea lozoyensis (strain ATCC 74030 / MF5533) TaxID=1104152 RepID=H0ENW9_GLAL7|nr:hypothetical protein M7I_4332 [Glarea lozoyensis 74030]
MDRDVKLKKKKDLTRGAYVECQKISHSVVTFARILTASQWN